MRIPRRVPRPEGTAETGDPAVSESFASAGQGFTVPVDGPLDGRPLLLLHGFPQDLRCWDAVVEQLVAEGFRCARYDQRGCDEAVRPTDVEEYALTVLVADAAAVLDELEWDDAIIVGHDWGAVVGWALAAVHPERVAGLVAVSVPHPASYSRALSRDPDQQARSAYLGLFRDPERAAAVLLADGARRLRAVYGDVPTDAIERYLTRFSDPATLTAALRCYAAMDRSTFAGLAAVTVPTWFVWGAEDIAVGRFAAESCGEWVTGDYHFVELPGVSHWVPETAPASVAGAVRGLAVRTG